MTRHLGGAAGRQPGCEKLQKKTAQSSLFDCAETFWFNNHNQVLHNYRYGNTKIANVNENTACAKCLSALAIGWSRPASPRLFPRKGKGTGRLAVPVPRAARPPAGGRRSDGGEVLPAHPVRTRTITARRLMAGLPAELKTRLISSPVAASGPPPEAASWRVRHSNLLLQGGSFGTPAPAGWFGAGRFTFPECVQIRVRRASRE
jgi:hypothetical protein